MTRPALRPTFLDAEYRPRVTFFTSSNDKFLQARLVFSRFGLTLRHSRQAESPYSEDYSGSGEHLLDLAVREIIRRGGAGGGIFFIEDTTIRVEALSGEHFDFPGLQAKEWFQATAFEHLDEELKARGNVRDATVSSTIALSVPGVGHVSYFKGCTQGKVADTPPSFAHNSQYPWLTPNNFNGWLMVDGAGQRLGEMSFERSWEYDFRVKAFSSLVGRIEEYTAVANARAVFFRRRSRASSTQPGLFELRIPIFIVIGPTCAGKTTFGDHGEPQNFRVLDASSVVRMMAEERTGSVTDATVYAKQLLESEGPDIVARRVTSLLDEKDSSRRGIIITGFRTIEEIEFIRGAFPRAIVVSIESGQRPRYERYLQRRTREQIYSFKEFQARDAEQYDLGLLEVASELADVRIANEGTLDEFVQQVEFVLSNCSRKDGEALLIPGGAPLGVARIPAPRDLHKSQLYRCMTILRDAGRPLTTQEIEAQFESGDSIRYNNANKILKRYPALVRRLESPVNNVRYKLTTAGLAYIRAIQDRAQ